MEFHGKNSEIDEDNNPGFFMLDNSLIDTNLETK